MATEHSLERCGIDQFDVLLLHNPDRTGYTSETVWDGMQALKDRSLTRQIGVAPGPANGFTLDLIDCFERFGDRIDWAMVILNPLEPWPGELCLDAAASRDINVITRVVDYGGLFYDDLNCRKRSSAVTTTAASARRLDRGRTRPLRADAPDRAGRRPDDDPARLPVEPCAPGGSDGRADAVQEAGPDARPVEDKRAELAALPTEQRLTAEDVDDDPRDRRQHRLDGAQGREPDSPATSAPTAGRSTSASKTSPGAGASIPRATSSRLRSGWAGPAGPPSRPRLRLSGAPARAGRGAASPMNSIGTRTTSSMASGSVQLSRRRAARPSRTARPRRSGSRRSAPSSTAARRGCCRGARPTM